MSLKCFFGFHNIETKKSPILRWTIGEENKKYKDILFIDTCKTCGNKIAYVLTRKGKLYVDIDYFILS